MSKKKSRPWKKHNQELVSLRCGVRCEVDKNIANLIKFLNDSGIETRHSCEGRKRIRGYVSMFATPISLGLAHYLLDHGGAIEVVVERAIHPLGYQNLTFRWPKKNQKAFEDLVRKYFRG